MKTDVLIGFRSLRIQPQLAALLIERCIEQDRRRRRRVRVVIGGRDYSALVRGYRIEMFGPMGRGWKGAKDSE